MNNQVRNGNIAELINEMADEINTILDNQEENQYFYGLIFLISFIENVLKWLVFNKVMWINAGEERVMDDQEVEKVRQFCRSLNFYNAQQFALTINVIDLELYSQINEIRRQRNDMIHQFWAYSRRTDYPMLRRELENLASVCNKLVEISNDLFEEIGVDEFWEKL